LLYQLGYPPENESRISDVNKIQLKQTNKQTNKEGNTVETIPLVQDGD
jgi:hypothetical protein